MLSQPRTTIVADLITGGNYMYLREKPVHASLLSVMGGWPWYVAETAVLAIAMLLVLEALTAAIVSGTRERA